MEALPPEVLCDIFLRCLTPSTGWFDARFEASGFASLRISHVCRKWRSLALSYGELWSHLSIDYSTRLDLRRRQMAVNIFDIWLSRTNGSPISFVFRCSLDNDDGVEDHRRAEYMITTLLSLQYRWKDVNFSWYGVKFSPEISGLEILNMPILTSLSLFVNLPVHVSINVTQSLQLKTLTLYGHFDLHTVSTPLRLLTAGRLEFWPRHGLTRSCAVQTCLDFLRDTLFLERFVVHIPSHLTTSTGRSHVPPLTLRSLLALKLEFGDAPAAILDNVTLPSLEALHYSSDVEAGIIFNFFQRSKPPLTFLSVHGDCATEDEIIGILRLLPGLQDLRYSDACVSKRFFRELMVKMPENEGVPIPIERIVCPRLEILHLHNLLPLDDIRECVEAWVNMLKSRARFQKSFERIYINLDVGRGTVVDVSDIGDYIEELEHCFEDWEGQLVAGDYEYVFDHPFPPSSC